ncbi:SIR2 family protein [Bacillus halotolerans]|uniref:SIR2 family protein n=1 Tax=Bacillus halotolerans TaxID=260554 RepID=UPI0007505D6A|nr:SIR2 family protein [Bacillus halotolerans]KUP33298.1 hypothetical protein AU385_07885 [Bacillus halotolerans]MDL5611059.1 SIR2 family protein [Bacillus halotolerans]
MGKFGLLIGNGFTVDFARANNLNSSNPLTCFDSEKINYNDFIENLPIVKSELIDNIQAANHYDVIKDYRIKYQNDTGAECQLRRFLATIYSKFQLNINSISLNEWKWFNWFKKNKFNLSFAISFNYDLLLERVLNESNIKYYRIGTIENKKRVPIFKPHGSIDFDVNPQMISGPNIWTTPISLNDCGRLHVVRQDEWMEPRIQADLIPPSSISNHLHLSWVREGLAVTERKAKEVSHFIIIGCSYCEVDRLEIDIILKMLKKRTKVIICDPFPSEPLINKIKELKLDFEVKSSESGLPWEGILPSA